MLELSRAQTAAHRHVRVTALQDLRALVDAVGRSAPDEAGAAMRRHPQAVARAARR